MIRSSIGKRFEFQLWVNSALKGFVLILLLFFLIAITLNAMGIQQSGSYEALLAFLVLPVFSAGFFQFSMIRIRGQIRLYMKDQRTLGVKPPVCLKCGYAVEETSNRCPECGAAV